MDDNDVGIIGMVHLREEDNEGQDRNVRPNIGIQNRPDPFRQNREINMRNIEVVSSQTAGVMQRRPFNPNSNLISLHSLISSGSRHGTNIILVILSITSVSASSPTQVQQRYNGSRGQVNTVRHDRRMVVMCPLSPEGSNTAMVLFGSGACERFFDYDISLRDHGAIRPGAMLLLVNPPGTDKYLANGTTPILTPMRPAIVIQSRFHLPLRHIVTEGTDISGFILNNCTVSVLSFQVRNTRCGGNLCDRQQETTGKCACYQMMNRSGNVVVSIEMRVTLPDGNIFNTVFQSKWFLENYIMTAPLPAGTRAISFEDYEVEDRFFRALESVTTYVNTMCQFRVVGWVKRGEVQDQGVDQPSNGLPHHASRVLVQSGSLNHHITRLDAMVPERLDLQHMEGMKFDVVDGFILS